MPLGIISEDDFDRELARLGLRSSKSASEPQTPPKDNVIPVPDSSESENIEDTEDEAVEGEIVNIQRGRTKGAVEVPESLRALIGQTALEGNRSEARALAKAFGLSDSAVSAYSNGATSTASYNQPDTKLAKRLDDTRNIITGKAKAKLISAIDSITEDKLTNGKLRDVAATAQAMSAIVRNLESPGENSNQTVNVVVYAPKMRGEEAFEVIDVRE